ncbi:MAG: hypothetical protein VX121_06120, partial [Pseudomonadota bacterium]|nr:hypothetical protein [Pseudomonadota bacterium]
MIPKTELGAEPPGLLLVFVFTIVDEGEGARLEGAGDVWDDARRGDLAVVHVAVRVALVDAAGLEEGV